MKIGIRITTSTWGKICWWCTQRHLRCIHIDFLKCFFDTSLYSMFLIIGGGFRVIMRSCNDLDSGSTSLFAWRVKRRRFSYGSGGRHVWSRQLASLFRSLLLACIAVLLLAFVLVACLDAAYVGLFAFAFVLPYYRELESKRWICMWNDEKWNDERYRLELHEHSITYVHPSSSLCLFCLKCRLGNHSNWLWPCRFFCVDVFIIFSSKRHNSYRT